jgi:acyl-CoA thioesterase
MEQTEMKRYTFEVAKTANKIEIAKAIEEIFGVNIRPESKNPYGVVHGSAIYTMADNATGYAAHSDGRSYVTQTSSMHFLRNQTHGVVRADAKVRHRGRATCLVDVDILGEGGRLLATGEFTYFCVDPELMAKKAEEQR